jgi:hypothetical protein
LISAFVVRADLIRAQWRMTQRNSLIARSRFCDKIPAMTERIAIDDVKKPRTLADAIVDTVHDPW